jgi:hypothetical protein
MAGVFLTRRGLRPSSARSGSVRAPPTNRASKTKALLPFASLDDVVFAWDIFPDNAYQVVVPAKVLAREHSSR